MKRLIPIVLLLCSPVMFAVDGQTLINQSSVAETGGYPYRITQPGSYKLSGNLVAALNTGAIQIQSSHVTLDLNGFNVTCSFNQNVLFGSCINDAQGTYNGITVINGSITAMGTAPTNFGDQVTGLNLQTSSGELIEDLHFDGVGSNYGINGIFSGANSIIRNNTFNASPAFSCPSLVEGNINQTESAGGTGSGCVYVNNVGLFPIM